MSKVVLREKFAASTAAAESNATAASVDTPPVIHELKHYHPFSGAQSFRLSRIRRDSFVAEHRSIGVFTSGGDASGNILTISFLILVNTLLTYRYVGLCLRLGYVFRASTLVLHVFTVVIMGMTSSIRDCDQQCQGLATF